MLCFLFHGHLNTRPMPALLRWIFRQWRLLARHGVFWCLVALFFVLFFGRTADGYRQSLLFVALMLPVAMATTYFLTAFLIPRYLLPRRYGMFALYALYTLIASVYLELVVLIGSFILLAGYEIRLMNPAMLDVFGLVVALYVVVFLAIAANLAMRWHRLQATHAETERARLEAVLALREAELARLKTQMHPHFLFNTLNNLYGLTLEQSEAAPDVVLRIADMLDYMLYRCDAPFVPLAGELDHLRTYLDLERLRYDDRVTVHLHVDKNLPDVVIAPLLLMPLVENSFKHSASPSDEPAWINIGVRLDHEQLHFSVANSKPTSPSAPNPDLGTGIGLANVRQRLHLLYPGTHALDIDDAADQFVAALTLPIQPVNDALPARG